MSTLTLLQETPNDQADRLIGRRYLSPSAMSTYQQCPRKFAFRYVDGLPEEATSSNLVFGRAIHATLEAYFHGRLAGEPALQLDDLMVAYDATWTESDCSLVRFGASEDLDSLRDLANRMLAAFLTSNAATPAGAVLGVEEELCGPVHEDLPDLLTRLDLIVDAGDRLVLVDFKTSRSRWSNEQLAASAGQLLLYAAAAKELADGRPIDLQFVVLTKTKSPSVETLRVNYTSSRIHRQLQTAQDVWNAIKARLYPPNPSPVNCASCGYRRSCQAWHDEPLLDIR